MESSFNDPANSGEDAHVPAEAAESPTTVDFQHETETEPSFNLPDSEPSVTAHGDFLPIAAQQITLDRIIGLIVSALVLVGALVGLGIYFFSIDTPDWIFWSVAAASFVVVTALTLLAIIWPPIEVRNIFWRLESTGLEIRRGVFWKHQVSIPSSRVQHIDVSQGPFQRNFDLATLTIHTAGTANASVDLAGLNFENATGLRDQLMEQRESLNVV